jgi:hypothetical protein
VSRLLSFLAAGLFGVLLSACSGGGGGDDAVVTVPPPARSALPLALMTTVQDATTRDPLALSGNDKVSVVVYGADADKVVDGDGKSLYDAAGKFAGPLTSSDGIFTLYLKPGTAGAFTLNLRVVASARNYVTSSKDLVVSDQDLSGDGSVRTIQVPISLISLTPAAQPESVVGTQVKGNLAANGATTAPIVATTPTATATTEVNGVTTTVSLGTANASIPDAVIAYSDAARTKPLPAGNVSVDVVYNNNMTTSSLATFPGGFITREDSGGQPLTSPGSFISGGFASIEVSSTAADGTITKAKTFDKPISVTISLPKGTINPETGIEVKAGEIIPIWSYDTTTGEWSAMRMTSTGAIITGQLGALRNDDTYPVTFVTDHLSYFNLDWFAWKDGIGKSKVAQCDTAPITIKGAQSKPLYLEAVMTGGGWMHYWLLDGGVPDPVNDRITYAPKNLKMTINAYYGTNRADAARLVGTVTVNDVCSGVNLDVTAGMARFITTIRTAALRFTVREQCDTDSTKVSPVPSDTLTASATGVPIVTAGTSAAGVASLNGLVVGKSYTITVKNRDGQQQKVTALIADTNPDRVVNFPVKCQTTPVTGGSTR